MKCIIFGVGGREAIIAKELAKEHELYAYISHGNATILECAAKTGGKYIIDKEYDLTRIKKFLVEEKIEFCVVNSDGLLEKGVIDVAKECGLITFGPTRVGARIEWDKAYALEVIRKIAPDSLVRTETISDLDRLSEVIKGYDGVDFVIKPNGLTGGKGVKVGGEHFKTKEEGLEYATKCLKEDGCVILQDKMVGHEFSLMGFTNGRDLVLAPCTYDYPYRFDGDKGPGTGGMGVVTFNNGLLPFLNESDLEKCKDIMKKTLDEINKDSLEFNGVLYGGFFKTAKGIYFMEFNSRLGDPEALNILMLMETPFALTALTIANEEALNKYNCSFKKQASYVVYVVSREYAVNSKAEPIKFLLPEELTENEGFYCANMEKADGETYVSVGNSRLFALAASGEDLMEIKKSVDEVLEKYIGGSNKLDYRTDIGVEGL